MVLTEGMLAENSDDHPKEKPVASGGLTLAVGRPGASRSGPQDFDGTRMSRCSYPERRQPHSKNVGGKFHIGTTSHCDPLVGTAAYYFPAVTSRSQAIRRSVIWRMFLSIIICGCCPLAWGNSRNGASGRVERVAFAWRAPLGDVVDRQCSGGLAGLQTIC